jgi:hypothetical protein
MLKNRTVSLLCTLVLGLLIFEGLPALGFEWMGGHTGIWRLLLIVYPIIILPLVCVMVQIADRSKRTCRFGITICAAFLIPESLLIIYREFSEYAPVKLWSIWDAVTILILFAGLAFLGGIIAPSMVRKLENLIKGDVE